MSKSRSGVKEQAIGWIIRLRDPAFADWDGFTEWLEQDPSHREIYQALAIADERIADLLSKT